MQNINGKPRILVVDDEETLCEALRFNLEEAGYAVDVAYSAEEALTLDISAYSLILLDIMMGDINGMQFASILKRKESTARIPIIFCTAKDAEDNMVEGLELGADDYIVKPYSIKNVLARVKAVLRRAGVTLADHATSDEGDIRFEGLAVSRKRKTCTLNGVDLRLPRKEFEILLLLMSHPDQIFTRSDLLKRVWPDEVVVLDRVVDVNITRLRSKLGEYGKHIVTRSGYGYGFFK